MGLVDSEKHRQAKDAYLEGLARFGSKPGLTRMRQLLQGVGFPERHLSIVNVVGTNGKGSTASFLACMARRLGYRVGLYTSPHLSSFRERIILDGECIPAASFERLLMQEVAPVAEKIGQRDGDHPTEFEVLTTLALLYFARSRTDLAILEAGMGGRLDATNVNGNRATVITPVSLDHQEVLGHQLGDIAAEKAAMVKPGSPVLAARQCPEVERVLVQRCREQKAPLSLLGRDYWTQERSPGVKGWEFSLGSPAWQSLRLRINRLGAYQVENAAVALVVVMQVLRPAPAGDLWKAVPKGLVSCPWPGRLELFPGNPDILLDVAHNPQGMESLRAALEVHFPGRPVTLVFGALADKDVPGMIQVLAPVVRDVIVTRARSPRAMDEDALYRLWEAAGTPVRIGPDIAAALNQARHLMKSHGLVLVCGSFALVGPIRGYLSAETGDKETGAPLS